MSTYTGKIVRKDGSPGLFVQGDGQKKKAALRRDDLAPALAAMSDDELVGTRVDYEWDAGKATKVRPHGKPVPANVPPVPSPSTWSPGTSVPGTSSPIVAPHQALAAGNVRVGSLVDRFHNPYGFVPAPDRAGIHPELADVGDRRRPGRGDQAGQAWLAGHDRLWEDRWSGRIAVRLEVVTPLVLLDTARYEENPDTRHRTYPVAERFLDGAMRPHLPSTTVKGMLRSDFEAVTNSRMGVFVGHDDRLAYRMAAEDGLNSVPARVSDDGLRLELQLGRARLGTQAGTPKAPTPARGRGPSSTSSSRGEMHAAWLPFYWEPGKGVSNIRALPDGTPLQHGDQVWARLELFDHGLFRFWWVRAVAASKDELPPRGREPRLHPPTGIKRISGSPIDVEGHVCITNQNIDKKHDERFFFNMPSVVVAPYEIGDDERKLWREVIRTYRAVRLPRGPVLPDPDDPLKKDVSSRHLYARSDEQAELLHGGDLLYVQLDTKNRICGLYPVSISRVLFPDAPARLLPESVRPARSLAELSPADRVFGWVRTESPGSRPAKEIAAWAGCLRVGPVVCEQTSKGTSGRQQAEPPDGGPAVARFAGDGLPLAILGEPKPAQGRFYLGRPGGDGTEPLGYVTTRGEPRKIRRKDWFDASGQTLRGRKVYRHHAGLPEGYWQRPWVDRTQKSDDAGRYQEYRRPHEIGNDERPLTADKRRFEMKSVTNEDEQRDDQNRSIRGWVRPKTAFRFAVEVRNLSSVELGALLWLLDLGAEGEGGGEDGDRAESEVRPERYHRVGFGKPLGFGSVRLTVDWQATDMRDGQAWKQHYTCLLPAEAAEHSRPATKEALAQAVEEFQHAVAAGSVPFEQVGHIDAFLHAATGDPDVPVHYPRARPEGMNSQVPVPPDPRGRSFEWFVENERPDAVTQALPDLAGHTPLTVHARRPKPKGR